MKRRQFVFSAATFALLGGCGVWPDFGKPTASRVPRVGILDGSGPDNSVANDQIAGLKQGLAEQGYVDGQNVIFELRDSGGKVEPLAGLANELVKLPVDVIVAVQTAPTQAAQQATTQVPIVFIGPTDPIGKGIVGSFEHPGGNITGVTKEPDSLVQRDLQFLDQLVAPLSRVAVIINLDPALGRGEPLAAVTPAANAMGVQLKVLDVRSADDVETALTDALAWRPDALMQFGAPGTVGDAAWIPRLVNFQLQNRIPLAVGTAEAVKAGGLLSYGASFDRIGRAAAGYVDKILKGARPKDLPVEQPTVFELAINRTTAHRLGITIPSEVAQQVTEWVQ